MDEFEKHYAEQKKLDTKDYVLHLYEMSRKDKSVKTENKSVMPRAHSLGSGREVVIVCKGSWGSFVAVWTLL